MPQLVDILDLSLFGVGPAKTFQELEAEIANGESLIIWDADRPIRLVRVVCVHVFSHTGEQLVEDRQEFTDGRVRRRGMTGVSEKLKVGEAPLEGAKRALTEELGIDRELTLESLGESWRERLSTSYPGLLSRYATYAFRVTLPKWLYQPIYIEQQASKRTIFQWRAANCLPNPAFPHPDSSPEGEGL